MAARASGASQSRAAQSGVTRAHFRTHDITRLFTTERLKVGRLLPVRFRILTPETPRSANGLDVELPFALRPPPISNFDGSLNGKGLGVHLGAGGGGQQTL